MSDHGYMMVIGGCCNCHKVISYNPECVPSIRVNGEKEPLCEVCFNVWNEIHRVSKGLPKVPLHKQAYAPSPRT